MGHQQKRSAMVETPYHKSVHIYFKFTMFFIVLGAYDSPKTPTIKIGLCEFLRRRELINICIDYYNRF